MAAGHEKTIHRRVNGFFRPRRVFLAHFTLRIPKAKYNKFNTVILLPKYLSTLSRQPVSELKPKKNLFHILVL